MKRVLVLTNAKAGTIVASGEQDLPAQIRALFGQHGIDAEVRQVEGSELTGAARQAAAGGAFDLIAAAGGDGTLNAVASGLMGTDIPFGIIPLGTFNHLAKELGIPLSVDGAVAALVEGRTIPFNVGEVNGRPFLLFAAIGLYTEMIRHRDAQRKVLGRRKMWAGLLALWKMLVRWRLLRVRVAVDEGDRFQRVTPTAYVSVSDYQIRALGVDVAEGSARDHLHVYLAATTRRGGLVATMVRWCLKRVRPWADFELLRGQRVELRLRSPVVRVGIDGEVVDIETPLRCRLVQRALALRIPGEPEADPGVSGARDTGISAC